MPNYPYISGQAPLVAAFAQLRKSAPPTVDASYLQRFNIAPANESYVISILRFLGLIDDDGNWIEENASYFYGDDDSFEKGLEATLRSAYSKLFDEMGDEALDADSNSLAHWFRAIDKTSELVGKRQASTFKTLAALAGHGELPSRSTTTAKKSTAGSKASAKRTTPKKTAKKSATKNSMGGDGGGVAIDGGQDVGLAVRIEVNLPASGDAETYDAIFASIKKHLMS